MATIDRLFAPDDTARIWEIQNREGVLHSRSDLYPRTMLILRSPRCKGR